VRRLGTNKAITAYRDPDLKMSVESRWGCGAVGLCGRGEGSVVRDGGGGG
jgi:hypothetical protein